MRSSKAKEETGVKRLPARASRGTRINKLIGEEAEADETFWGQDVWRDEEDDEDYSTEEEEEDTVDADFDDEERPDEDVHDEEEEETGRRSSARTNRQKRKVYQEPKKPVKKAKLVVEDQAGDDGEPQQLENQRRPSQTFEYEAPTVRRSTARRTSASSELRKRTIEEAARQALKAKKPVAQKNPTRLTQAELLREAVRTEVENTQSLNQLEQLEEEKKMETIAPKAPFTGQMVRYHSRIGEPKTITFLNTDEFPAIFNQPKPKKPHQRTPRAAATEQSTLSASPSASEKPQPNAS
ncbi:TPA: hypothetical protein N0F65_009265 [Lagenidium giganteum]|uniref:Vps72/YL1 N-terminal domain-containing protein n=1 Tax=Lagenidium giganteum TaxID=4803 RepID=A0AAV2YRD6_9STRA|nr:TPA: hypothetical protein N0F65_009265 [Lagenidium giganteum]